MEMFHSIALLDADSTLSSLLLVFSTSIHLQNVQVPKNDVQIAINNALKLQPIQDGLLAMGLVGKHVTGPWMRLVGREWPILELNTSYVESVEKLEAWSQDAIPLLDEESPCIFNAGHIKKAAYGNVIRVLLRIAEDI